MTPIETGKATRKSYNSTIADVFDYDSKTEWNQTIVIR